MLFFCLLPLTGVADVSLTTVDVVVVVVVLFVDDVVVVVEVVVMLVITFDQMNMPMKY